MIKFISSKGELAKKRVINSINRKSSLSALSYAITNEKYEVATELVECGAQQYYDKTKQHKDFSPIFLCILK